MIRHKYITYNIMVLTLYIYIYISQIMYNVIICTIGNMTYRPQRPAKERVVFPSAIIIICSYLRD